MDIPSSYLSTYKQARKSDPVLADRYLEHTLIGDPLADAAVASLPDDQREVHRLIQAGMDQDAAILDQAPRELRDFFTAVSAPPEWFDPGSVYSGCRLFHRHSDLFLVGFVCDTIVQGFTTTISKSFLATGRLIDHGVRRLRQNNLHLMEIFIPGGLERDGDGWKMSVRIRLVHAQVRRQLLMSNEWDTAELGTPLSAANIALASVSFSALLLQSVAKLGVHLDHESRASFMHVWRYTAWLIGVPESILFRNEAEAIELYRVGFNCEPPPDVEAIIMANMLINSAPLVVGVTDPEERRKTARYVFRVSRALIGDEMADQLRFPKQRTAGLLWWIRWSRRLRAARSRLFAGGTQFPAGSRTFSELLNASALDHSTISYQMPDHLYSNESRTW